MPHDKSGRKLEVGDIVTLQCRVKEVYEGESACNVQLEAMDGKPNEHRPVVTCNASSVQKISNESLQQAADRGFKEAQP